MATSKVRKIRGRRPKGPFEDKRAAIGARVTLETRQKLDAAAKESGRSLAQEIELRLKRSFDDEGAVRDALDFWFGRKAAGMALLIAHVMRMAGGNVRLLPTEGMPSVGWDWFPDAYAYDQAAQAVERVLERYRPDGDPSIMPNGEKAGGWSKRGIGIADLVLDGIAKEDDAYELEGQIRARLGAPRKAASGGTQ